MSVWNGKAFEISDLRGPAATRVTHTVDVVRPASEELIYVLVNGTNGRIASDGVHVLPWSSDVAGADARAAPRAAARAHTQPTTRVETTWSVPGRAPLYLAACRSDGKAVLVGSSSARGVSAADDHELEHLAKELAGASWYPVPADGNWQVLSERFEAPTVTAEDGLRLLEVSSCDAPGMIYSTAPMTELESPTAYSEQAVRSMQRTARAVVGRKLGAIDAAPADGRSWLSLAEPQTRVEIARWLRPRIGAAYWIGLIRWDASESECEGESCGSLAQEGLWLVWIRGAQVQTVRVVVKELKA